MTDRDFAIEVVRQLRAAGHEAYWAGGCVRDELLGLQPDDYDVATSARPEEVMPLFRRTVAVGVSFGVVEVIGARRSDGSFPKVQVATFRSDGAYVDGRRPQSVRFSSAAEDAQRRDFTINGMFFDPIGEQVIDYVGGRADLKAGLVRAIGNPQDRFREDKLRLLRAVRLSARFAFEIEAGTAAALRAMASEIVVVSKERIAEELRKLFTHPNRVRGLELLRDSGLLLHVLPEAPTGAALDHALARVRHLSAGPIVLSFPLVLAAFLQDSGPKRAVAQCRGLKLSNQETERVEWLVRHAADLVRARDLPLRILKPFLIHPGIDDLLRLHRACAECEHDPLAADAVSYCETMRRQLPPERLDPPPLLTGADLLALGWKEGPRFRTALQAVRDAQLDERIQTREEALRLVRELQAPSSES